MAEARAKDNWAHTSAVLALTANTHRDPKKSRPFRPDDFNPYAARRRGKGIAIQTDNIDVLKTVFVDNEQRSKQ